MTTTIKNYEKEVYQGIGGTLNLQNLTKIKEAMDSIKPVDKSDFFELYYEEITDRIKELKDYINFLKQSEQNKNQKSKSLNVGH